VGETYVLFGVSSSVEKTLTTSTPISENKIVSFKIMEKNSNNNTLYVKFLEGTIPTSTGDNESWFVAGKATKSGALYYVDWWIRVYDSDKPCRSHDTGNWYTFEPALNPGIYYLDEDDSAYTVKYIINFSAYTHNTDTNKYDNKYQISNFYAKSEGTMYYMFKPF
jgi:hypothetical protein